MGSHLGSSCSWRGISLPPPCFSHPTILPFCIHHRQVLEVFPAGFAAALMGLDFAPAPAAGWRCLDNKRMWRCWPWIITPAPSPSCAPPPLACHEFPAFLVFPESLVQPEFFGIFKQRSPHFPAQPRLMGLCGIFSHEPGFGAHWMRIGYGCILASPWDCGIPFPDGIFSGAVFLQATSAHPAAAFRGKIQASPKALEGGFTPKYAWGGNESKVAVKRFPGMGEIHETVGQGNGSLSSPFLSDFQANPSFSISI